jgi:hypothetical protein
MFRRNFLKFFSLGFLGLFAPKVQAKTEVTSQTKVFYNSDSGCTTEILIVTDDEKTIKHGNRYPVMVASHKSYQVVADFVFQRKERFDYLLNNGPELGCIFYWEENYGDKFRVEICKLHPDIDHRQIDNSLYAFENEFVEIT